EAESWYKQALALTKPKHFGSPSHVRLLLNVAGLLATEVRKGRADRPRLAEAWNYAEQALALAEGLENSYEVESWTILDILAKIADLDDRTEIARVYRCRSHEAILASPIRRNFYHEHWGPFLITMAAAVEGN